MGLELERLSVQKKELLSPGIMHIATLNLSTTPSLRPRSILISLHVYVNLNATIRKVREYAFWVNNSKEKCRQMANLRHPASTASP